MRIAFKRLVAILLITPLLGGDVWLCFIGFSASASERSAAAADDELTPENATIEASASIGLRFIRLEPSEQILANCLNVARTAHWQEAESSATGACLALESQMPVGLHPLTDLHLRI